MTKKSSPTKKPAAKVAPKAAKPETKASKGAAKPVVKAPAPKAATPKPAGAKPATKPAPKPSPKSPPKAEPPKAGANSKAPAPAKAHAAPAKPAPPAPPAGRKGITIVTPKPVKKPSPARSISRANSPGGSLLGPGSPVRRPLIPSGPSAARPVSFGDGADLTGKKSPFSKKELTRFRTLLLAKRAELIGDVKNMEQEALRGNAGSLSNLPQHMADQGSDAYDQALALDLAAVDRRLIKEIEDALKRITEGTYGLCELTGKPIKLERLEEIPWARHSIEAAREMERRFPRP